MGKPSKHVTTVAIYSSDKSEMKLERLKPWSILPRLNVKISMCVVPMTLQTLSSGKRTSGEQIREDLIPRFNYVEQTGISLQTSTINKWESQSGQRTVLLYLPNDPIIKYKLFTTLIESNQFVAA